MRLIEPLLTLPTGRRAVVAVSGGRDSAALLHALATHGNLDLMVCHLNHGLRGAESDADAEFVEKLAAAYGLPCRSAKSDVAGLAARRQCSIETAAREARHQLYAAVAVEHQSTSVFLAHHADDQAETILANLCRGAGLAGVSGMRPVTELSGIILLRPLLHATRAEIDAYVTRHQLAFREDSSNASRDHRRNRLRHEVLPLLDVIYQRDVSRLIVRFGELAAQADEFLDQLAGEFLGDLGVLTPDHALLVRRARQVSPALLGRVIRRWLLDYHHVTGLNLRLVDEVIAMLEPGGPAKINLPDDQHLRRTRGRLWVQRACGEG